MSTSTSAFGLAAIARGKTSRKPASISFAGSAAIGALVLGCLWTVYANVFAAGVYPTVRADSDAPIVRRPAAVALTASTFAKNVFTSISKAAPVISAPATIPARPSLSFDDRFAAAARHGVEPTPQPEDAKIAEVPRTISKIAEAPKPKERAPSPRPVQLAAIAPPPGLVETKPPPAATAGITFREMAERAKAAIMRVASPDRSTISEKLWGKPEQRPSLLSFASADASATGSVGPTPNLALAGTQPRYERDTAVYDISAHMVYLPDGSTLEAHSGLGSKLDDPSSASIRMHGVTPPHLYELKPRETLFHGVPALRLTPVGGEEAIFGRSGLLAHTFMLGPNGDSNGCVSFRDYEAFLNAYRNQGIKRLAVVTRID
jgi:hypothetical protein